MWKRWPEQMFGTEKDAIRRFSQQLWQHVHIVAPSENMLITQSSFTLMPFSFAVFARLTPVSQ
jgi:hypothetical protein